MGLDIGIETLDGAEHPDWETERYAGDKEIISYIEEFCPLITYNKDPLYIKPRNLDELLESNICNKFPYPERFKKMITILKNNPDYWIYVCI